MKDKEYLREKQERNASKKNENKMKKKETEE